MSTGQMILTIGIVLIVTGALTALIGEWLLFSQKKMCSAGLKKNTTDGVDAGGW